MTKPDLSKMKRLDPDEAKARLRRRRAGEKPAGPDKIDRKLYPKRTVVSSVSVPPELLTRIKRDIGEGSFSRGVVKAATFYLMEVVDKLEAAEKRYRGD
jgi:hypothetical protein